MTIGYDQKVPPQLKKIQQWFASIIVRPIDEDSRMNPISPKGIPMEEEAFEYIIPSPTLRPAQRIQIYNQQYWWRLLNCLHEAFPLLTRLFGHFDFNQTIGIPYLTRYHPYHWSLNTLGTHLTKFLEEEYHAEDKQLVLNAAALDWAFNHAFCCKKNATIPDGLDFSECKIWLQPYVHLFQMDYNLIEFRMTVIKEKPEYWSENEFPKLPKEENKRHFALWRNHNHDISWDDLHPAAYALLNRIREGATLDELCDWLEEQDEAIRDEASKNLQVWFTEWTIRRLLTLEPLE